MKNLYRGIETFSFGELIGVNVVPMFRDLWQNTTNIT